MAVISQHLIDRYAEGPSKTRSERVKRLHENIRKALDESSFSYETFLQGSYRNDTAIADINDVDVVALRKYQAAPQSSSDWRWEFDQVLRTLRDSWRVPGAVKRGDKCVKVEGEVNADVVPAIRSGSNWETDPVVTYSLREVRERENYPRRHYRNGVSKQQSTNARYKATVRVFKRWVRQYPSLYAPSFYIESAVHSVSDVWFDSYLPRGFRDVGRRICEYSYSSKYLQTVAGDKDILRASEWPVSDFEEFQSKLRTDTALVNSAMSASAAADANYYWRRAFGD